MVNKSGNATEDTLDDIDINIAALISGGVPAYHDAHLKVLGYHERIGHLGDDVERANGSKSGIGAGGFTIIESNDFIQPSADTQMYLQSTDAQDAAAGTGAQQITIEYFSLAWGARKSVRVVPTGTGQVTISVSDIYRIHKVYTNKGASAAGDISITNLAETVLYGQIDSDRTTMERCIFYVAENEIVTCTEASASSVTSGGVEVRLVASAEDSEGNIIPRVRVPVEVVSGGLYVPFVVSEAVANPNNLRIALLLVVQIASPAGGQRVTGHMKGFKQPM